VSVALACGLALGGCGSGDAGGALSPDGASSPEGAVEHFLDVFSDPPDADPGRGGRATDEVTRWWARACDQVDPRIRRALHASEDRMDPRVNCGAGVVLQALETGENTGMAPASRISGDAVSSTPPRGGTSVVTAAVHYETTIHGQGLRPPPAKATVRVLAVERDGGWWVATPIAFNPQAAAHGGLDANELKHEYEKLLAGG
jgi:hypothetical protein